MTKKSKKTDAKPDVKPTKQPITHQYRVLGLQPLSVKMDPQTLGPMEIQKTVCSISIRSVSDNPATQHLTGGSMLAIQFSSTEDDFLVAARQGMSLLEDFLSALALVTGSTFRSTEPVQVARITEGSEECDFYIFKQLPISHWGVPITEEKIRSVKHILANWDGLEDGHRLRRAALQYREAIGNLDDTSAFQEAYIGLETLEPPLAKAQGLTPGTEEVSGKCEHCANTFTRKKSSLVGVRSFVLGTQNPIDADKECAAEWQLMNKLRNDLMHGLVDPEMLQDRPHKAMLSAMAHLHSALCLHSQTPSLVTNPYRLARGGEIYLFCGTYEKPTWPALHEWGELLEFEEFSWVAHKQYGWVPEIKFRNNGLQLKDGLIAKLTTPFSIATSESLEFPRFETDD